MDIDIIKQKKPTPNSPVRLQFAAFPELSVAVHAALSVRPAAPRAPRARRPLALVIIAHFYSNPKSECSSNTKAEVF